MTILRAAVSFALVVTLRISWPLGAQQMQALKAIRRILSAHPSFDVASIKKADPDSHSSGFQTQGRRVFIENETVNAMISYAYGVHAKQIVGGPAWFGSERFDIRGLPDVDGIPNTAQYREMLIKLLAERFGLKFHQDRRELACYAVTVAKGGPKIEATKSGPDGLPDQSGRNSNGQASWRFTNNSMEDFAKFLQFQLDRPVVDQTGLKGKYDFKLAWTKDNAPVTDDNAKGRRDFLRRSRSKLLGLKIEPVEG